MPREGRKLKGGHSAREVPRDGARSRACESPSAAQRPERGLSAIPRGGVRGGWWDERKQAESRLNSDLWEERKEIHLIYSASNAPSLKTQ